MKINYLEEKKTNNTANFATDTSATAKTTSPKPKYRFVMGEKKRKAEASGQKFTDTWTPPKQTEDYYPEPVSLETFNALNPDGGNSNSLYSLKKAQREGTRIRNSLKNVLSQTNTGNYSADVFDDIDDDTIEKNIPLAEESLNLNKSRTLTKDISEKYPYYRDGMAMMYAADEKGNKTAAKAAKLAAYTEVVEKLKDIGTSKMQNANLFANTKGSFNDVISGIQKNYGIDTQTQKTSETIKSEDKAQDMYSSVLQNLPVDANIEVKPEDLLLMSEKIDNGALELQKLSNKASFNYDDINEILSRAEKLPGSLKKEERELLETVLKNTALPLQLRNKIQDVLAQPEVKITEADPDSVHNSVRIRHELTEDFNTKVKNYVRSQVKQFMNDTFSLSIVTRAIDGLNNMLNSSALAKIIGNPSLNYYFNKKIDLSKTGAMKGIYINDQSKLKEYAYGIKDIDCGGCGIVAMYNVLKGLNKPIDFAELIRENEETALLKGVLGTSPYGITKFLRESGFEVTADYKNVDSSYDASGADAVIHLYFREDGTAHYVAGISNGDGTFYFYNSDHRDLTALTWREHVRMTEFENSDNNVTLSCIFKIKRK